MEKTSRITSVDLLRGIVMVIMALDHVRHLWHYDHNNPEDLSTTTPLLFFTRWITHFCAPVFIFLTGTGAYFYAQKPNSHTFRFLFTRGLWLIFLELTVFSFGWQFELNTTLLMLVIWAIGVSMIFLSVWIRLPYIVILITGLVLVLFHNLLDPVNPEKGSAAETVWTFLHAPGAISITENFRLFVLYPVLPYFGLISLGYCLGKLYSPQTGKTTRKKFLIILGISALCLFVVFRWFNLYGDPAPFEAKQDATYTLLAFLKTTKYPTSLLYICMTIGPALLFLAFYDEAKGVVARFFMVFGKVPMFYYILHIYLIHGLAKILGGDNTFSLTTVFIAWVVVIIILYFPCRWYGKYKSAHPEKWWLSYI